jgi:hypothetical protein
MNQVRWMLAALGTSAAMTAAQAQVQLPPLPEGLTVSAPSAGTPPERAKYLGAWTGQLERDGLAVTYVVTAIEGDAAQVVYAHGAFAPWNISTPRFVNLEGSFTRDGAILTKLRSGAHLTGRLLPNGNLELTWQRGGNFTGELKPLALPGGGGK